MSQDWNIRYATAEYYYGKEANDYLQQKAHLFKPSSRILCLAEGEGRNAVYLAKLGHEVTAVDFSEVALSKAQKLAQENKVQIHCIQADLMQFDFGKEQWDAVISIWCHVTKSDRGPLHQKVLESLKSGGFFLLEAYTPKQIPLKSGGPKNPEMLPTAEDLKRELQGLQILELQEIQRDIHEGQGHNGLSEVVQMLAQKK